MDAISLKKIQALRKIYLGNEVSKPYWDDLETIESYDAILGEKNRWKWKAALQQSQLSWNNFQNLTLVDFGCGTGSASEAFLNFFPKAAFRSLVLLDRQLSVLDFTRKKIQSLFPTLPTQASTESKVPEVPYFLLLSHISNEIAPSKTTFLNELLAQAEGFFWLEPGTQNHSQKLISWRQKLQPQFEMLAPCPHQNICGLLKDNPKESWCHFFGTPPAEIFHSGFWKKVSLELKMDLRSLPFSYLVGQKKEGLIFEKTSASKIRLGKPKIYKGYWLETECSEEKVEIKKYLARENLATYRNLKKM